MKTATINILGSNALSQLLIIASTPFLTKLYSQSEFGLFGVATTISLLLSTGFSLRLEQSIHVVSTGATKLFNTCLHLIFGAAIFIALPIVIFLPETLEAQRGNAFLILLFSLSHAIVTSGVLHLSFNERFRSIAAVNLLIPSAFIVGAVIFGTRGLNANGLLLWQALAYTSGAIFVLAIQRLQLHRLSVNEIVTTIKNQKDNLRFLVPSSLLSILSLNLAIIGTSLIFDSAVAGLVVIAQRIARAPIGVIGNSLNEVLRASIPNRVHIYQTFRRIALSCVVVALMMIIVVIAVPESVYQWILGEQWSGIKKVLLITVTGASFQLIGTSVFSMLTSFNKKADMQVNLALVVCGLAALLVSYWLDLSAFGYLWVHTFLFSIIYSVEFYIAHQIAAEKSK